MPKPRRVVVRVRTNHRRVEAQQVEPQPVEARRVEAQQVEPQPVKAQQVEPRRVGAQRVGAQRVEARRVEAQQANHPQPDQGVARRLPAGTPPRAALVVLQLLVAVRDLVARRAEEALVVDVAQQQLLGVALEVQILVVPLVAVVGRIKAAVRRAVKVVGAAIVKSSNRWTCRITRPWMLPYLKVRW